MPEPRQQDTPEDNGDNRVDENNGDNRIDQERLEEKVRHAVKKGSRERHPLSGPRRTGRDRPRVRLSYTGVRIVFDASN
jgi:hypothetical protein